MSDETDKSGDGFLSRWSRKKTEVREYEDLSSVETSTEAEQSSQTNLDKKEEDQPVEELPDVETLDKDSDFTPFLKEGVPEKLKRLALRKLWLSDPAFGVLDGLNDYDEDFSAIGIVAQEIATRYKPGKGIVDPDEEQEGQDTIDEAEEQEGQDTIDEAEGQEGQDTIDEAEEQEGQDTIDEGSELIIEDNTQTKIVSNEQINANLKLSAEELHLSKQEDLKKLSGGQETEGDRQKKSSKGKVNLT